MDLVLPCRYSPGPLANDPNNFYQQTWWSVLDGTFFPISTDQNFLSNNSDFSLTLHNLSPVLAMYDYQCEISFNNNAPSQPYMLRSSSTFSSTDGNIDVIISQINSECMKNFSFKVNKSIFFSLHFPYLSHRSVVYSKRTE